MDDSSEKQKLSRRFRFPLGFLALGLAVGLCVLFRENVLSMIGFLGPCRSSLSYPQLLLAYDPPLRALAWCVVVLVFMFLMGIGLSRRVHAVLILGAFLVGAGLLVNTWIESGPLMNLTPLQGIRQDGTVYRLAYISGEGVGVDMTYPIRDFILLECDGIGWGRCDIVGSADMTVGGLEYFKEPDLRSTTLEFDESSQRLVVKMGDDTRSFIGCMLY